MYKRILNVVISNFYPIYKSLGGYAAVIKRQAIGGRYPNNAKRKEVWPQGRI